MNIYMDQLYPSVLEEFNNDIFISKNIEKELDYIDGEIYDLKLKLYKLLKLKRTKLKNNDKRYTKEMFSEFFKKHPAMYIQKGHNLTLYSKYQCVSLYDGNGEEPKTLYTTLPIYAYELTFVGKDTIGKTKTNFVYFLKDTNIRNEDYSHPNSHINSSGEFVSICSGNNGFSREYNPSILQDPDNFMVFLHKAATWMETTNLSDHYSTNLCPSVSVELDMDKNFISFLLRFLKFLDELELDNSSKIIYDFIYNDNYTGELKQKINSFIYANTQSDYFGNNVYDLSYVVIYSFLMLYILKNGYCTNDLLYEAVVFDVYLIINNKPLGKLKDLRRINFKEQMNNVKELYYDFRRLV